MSKRPTPHLPHLSGRIPTKVQPRDTTPTLPKSPLLWQAQRSPRARRKPTSIDTTFSALADPTRRALLERLASGEMSVTDLAKPFHMSLPAVSKHLGILEEAGLITRERDGRIHRCRLDPTPLIATASWFTRYRPLWEKNLQALGSYLERKNVEEQRK